MDNPADHHLVVKGVITLSFQRRYHGKWMPAEQWIDLIMAWNDRVGMIEGDNESINSITTHNFKEAIDKKQKHNGGYLAPNVVMHYNRNKITIINGGEVQVNTDFWCLTTHQTNVYPLTGGSYQVNVKLQKRWDQYMRWKIDPSMIQDDDLSVQSSQTLPSPSQAMFRRSAPAAVNYTPALLQVVSEPELPSFTTMEAGAAGQVMSMPELPPSQQEEFLVDTGDDLLLTLSDHHMHDPHYLDSLLLSIEETTRQRPPPMMEEEMTTATEEMTTETLEPSAPSPAQVPAVPPTTRPTTSATNDNDRENEEEQCMLKFMKEAGLVPKDPSSFDSVSAYQQLMKYGKVATRNSRVQQHRKDRQENKKLPKKESFKKLRRMVTTTAVCSRAEQQKKKEKEEFGRVATVGRIQHQQAKQEHHRILQVEVHVRKKPEKSSPCDVLLPTVEKEKLRRVASTTEQVEDKILQADRHHEQHEAAAWKTTKEQSCAPSVLPTTTTTTTRKEVRPEEELGTVTGTWEQMEHKILQADHHHEQQNGAALKITKEQSCAPSILPTTTKPSTVEQMEQTEHEILQADNHQQQQHEAALKITKGQSCAPSVFPTTTRKDELLPVTQPRKLVAAAASGGVGGITTTRLSLFGIPIMNARSLSAMTTSINNLRLLYSMDVTYGELYPEALEPLPKYDSISSSSEAMIQRRGCLPIIKRQTKKLMKTICNTVVSNASTILCFVGLLQIGFHVAIDTRPEFAWRSVWGWHHRQTLKSIIIRET